jgi:polyisoprenoid-binding protein YceI
MAETTTEQNWRMRRKLLAAAGALSVLGVVAIVLFSWWFLKDDAPDEVNLESAVAGVVGEVETVPTTSSSTATSSTATTSEPIPDSIADETSAPTTQSTTEPVVATTPPSVPFDGIEGAWVIDNTIGDFTFESATGSFVGFRIDETFTTIGKTTAVGRTSDVTGSILIEATTLVAAEIVANLSNIVTEDRRRDNAARGALNTDEFPNATFTLNAPIDLGPTAAEENPVSVTALGELTISGVTNSIEFAIEAQLVRGIVGSADVAFLTDYGLTVPSVPIILGVENHGIVEFQLLFVPSP